MLRILCHLGRSQWRMIKGVQPYPQKTCHWQCRRKEIKDPLNLQARRDASLTLELSTPVNVQYSTLILQLTILIFVQ